MQREAPRTRQRGSLKPGPCSISPPLLGCWSCVSASIKQSWNQSGVFWNGSSAGRPSMMCNINGRLLFTKDEREGNPEVHGVASCCVCILFTFVLWLAGALGIDCFRRVASCRENAASRINPVQAVDVARVHRSLLGAWLHVLRLSRRGDVSTAKGSREVLYPYAVCGMEVPK
jgi:hypothetical protein